MGLEENGNRVRGRSERMRMQLGSELKRFLAVGLEGAQVVGWWEIG